jgi:hypothetical protein
VAKWIAARPLAEVTEEFERVGAALAPVGAAEGVQDDIDVAEGLGEVLGAVVDQLVGAQRAQ